MAKVMISPLKIEGAHPEGDSGVRAPMGAPHQRQFSLRVAPTCVWRKGADFLAREEHCSSRQFFEAIANEVHAISPRSHLLVSWAGYWLHILPL